MARPHQAIAEQHGVSLDVIRKLSRAGVNVYDDEECKEALSKKRHRIKPDAKLSKEAKSRMGKEDTLESLKLQALQASSLDDAKIIKEKAAAMQGLIKVEKEQGRLISLPEINERDTRIAAAVAAAGAKIANDWPPECSGLTQTQMRKVMSDRWAEIARMLADEQSVFWKGKDE